MAKGAKGRVRKNVYLNEDTPQKIREQFKHTTFNGSLEDCIDKGLKYYDLQDDNIKLKEKIHLLVCKIHTYTVAVEQQQESLKDFERFVKEHLYIND